MEDAKLDQITKRLDVIIGLMLERDSEVTLGTKILRLHALGLSAPDVARILRKPGNQVRDVVAKERKKQTRSNKKETR